MTTRPLDGETEPRCCSGTPMAENIAEDGYCCAKPTDEELEEAQAAYDSGGNTGCCPHADAEALAEREPILAGGSKRAAHADMVVRLYSDGTYRILKNRWSNRFTGQTCVIYAVGENIIPFSSLSDQEKGKV